MKSVGETIISKTRSLTLDKITQTTTLSNNPPLGLKQAILQTYYNGRTWKEKYFVLKTETLEFYSSSKMDKLQVFLFF